MLARTVSGGLEGVNGFLVDVEAFLGKGMIGFDIVGLPSTAVKESRDRIRAAMLNLGYDWPMKKLTINLAPADVKKEGTSLELSIAIALLAAQNPEEYTQLDQTLLLGELTLHGELSPVRGVLSMVLAARDQGITSAILPARNCKEVQCLSDITVYPAETLKQVVDHLTGWARIQPQRQIGYEQLLNTYRPAHDLRHVKGQLIARKALEIAAAGGHNMLMVGVPGSGKTMLARCMPGILPPLSYEEALETTCIHSAAGTLEVETGLMTERPFRSPHHNVSLPAIVGGGVKAKPGEVSLAHNGVLFLDELPEYQRQTLEALRQPLEDGFVNVTRVSGQAKYQSRCMLVASMNPCPCGNHGSRSKPCRCKPDEIKRYLARISGPLLDRIDIQVEMDAVELGDIQSTQEQEDTLTVQKRVIAARNLQLQRYENESFFCNAQMPQEGIEKYCVMETAAKALLHNAVEKFHISMRTYSRICKVGRTIADLNGHETIQPQDIAQAIHMRNLDGRYWR
ncbi:MAG TPA: YifB family Mg chelatase-like AAA ATPase [Candidatus Limiplasma sp.]|nr:YifB family Mg chelatase-like AAA ATPase [Candidatus Limiplasma sp.]HRX09600.1 YifB family Mg chelatase-like AAA ATPase [Candidatus Limiplasma sp.]